MVGDGEDGWEFDPKQVFAWLCCDPLPPIPLGPRPRVLIGRGTDCDLRLPHKSISRHQAVIKVQGDSMVLEDLGSANGSLLNGRRVSSAPIKAGDVLTLGPYDVEVRTPDLLSSAAAMDDDMEGTREITMIKSSAALLQDVPLAETLQNMELYQRSATLRLLSGQQRGTIVVKDGRPVRATLGGVSDDEAILTMLCWEEGRITIEARVEPCEPSVRSTVTGLLLEASRRRDEARPRS